jgi:hypothetical protein
MTRHDQELVQFAKDIGFSNGVIPCSVQGRLIRKMSTRHVASMADAGMIIGMERINNKLVVTNNIKPGIWFFPTVKAAEYFAQVGRFYDSPLSVEDLAEIIATDPETTDQFKCAALELLALRMAPIDVPFVTWRIETLESQIEDMPHRGRIRSLTLS